MLQKFIMLAAILLLAACTSQPQQAVVVPQTIKCPNDRSPMCTREYTPVCATRDTGVRCLTTPCPSTEEKTYGNGCTACADVKVLHYRVGACEPNSEKDQWC